MLRYLAGDSEDDRQRLRDEVLSTSAKDFRAFADVLDQVKAHGSVVVLGSEQAIEKANSEQKLGLQVTKVL